MGRRAEAEDRVAEEGIRAEGRRAERQEEVVAEQGDTTEGPGTGAASDHLNGQMSGNLVPVNFTSPIRALVSPNDRQSHLSRPNFPVFSLRYFPVPAVAAYPVTPSCQNRNAISSASSASR
jgi:hypothetical protein